MYIQQSEYWPVASVFPQGVAHAFGRLFDDTAPTGGWTPAVDIREEAARYVITADVPGVDPKSIAIDMDKGVLSIRGERTAEAGEGSTWTRSERAQGKFERRFALPDSVDADAIRATNRNGVLVVSIAKRAEAAPRKIAVEVE